MCMRAYGIPTKTMRMGDIDTREMTKPKYEFSVNQKAITFNKTYARNEQR